MSAEYEGGFRVFGKKKEPREAEEIQSMSNALSLRGQLVASNRFKTWCCLFLFLIIMCQCAFIGVLMTQRKVIVGITSEGVPELLQPTTAELSLDMFVRDFVSRFFSFSPTTVRDNMDYASNRITSGLESVYEKSMGAEFFQSVNELGIVQITTIRDIKLADLTDSGFSALVTTGRLKSDKVEKQTVEQTVYISLKAVKGPITRQNPWGYYIDEVRESYTRPQ